MTGADALRLLGKADELESQETDPHRTGYRASLVEGAIQLAREGRDAHAEAWLTRAGSQDPQHGVA